MLEISHPMLAGVLLVAGAAVFFGIGFGSAALHTDLAKSGGAGSDDGLRAIGREPRAWRIIPRSFAVATVLNTLGYGMLAIKQMDAGERALSVTGIILLLIAAPTFIGSLAFNVSAVVDVGTEAASGSVPDWFRPLYGWSETLYRAYMILAYFGIGAFGVSLMLVGPLIPIWLAAGLIVFGVGWATSFVIGRPRIGDFVLSDLPLWVHVASLALGLALVVAPAGAS